jgi:polyhydroxyalkanoate synthesis regulator phasin
MPQPKRSQGRSTSSRSTKKASPGGARKRTTKASSARPKAASSRAKSSAKPKPKSAAKPRAKAKARSRSTASADSAAHALTVVRDLLSRAVVLYTDRLQEAMDDAVKRGRLTRSDAEELVASLVSTGRKQAQDALAGLEGVLGGSRGAAEAARKRTRERTASSADRVLREVDRARRAVGVGTFPVLGYDDLTAAQITDRLADLTAAQLRKVRDYERRHGNRKSVLSAIQSKLP